MYQSDEDLDGTKEELDNLIDGSPDFLVRYALVNKQIIVSVDASEENFDLDTLAEFIHFISSPDGVRTTVETVKEGLEGNGKGDDYNKFIISFLRRKQKDIAKSPGGPSDGPLIRPIDVL